MVRLTREKVDFSPAELALLEKFKTIKEKKALQAARSKKINVSDDNADNKGKKDARQIAIDIIRARRMASTEGGSTSGTQKKTKIKLTSSSTQPIAMEKSTSEMIDHEPEQKKKKRGHVVQVRRRGPVAQKQQQHMENTPRPTNIPALFVDNLPAYCTSDDLYHYFSEQWALTVLSTGIYEGCCSGLVTCSSFEDAAYILSEQNHREFEMGGNILSFTWATEEDIKAMDTTADAIDGPAPVDPRVLRPGVQRDTNDTHDIDTNRRRENDDNQGRNVVSYDDL